MQLSPAVLQIGIRAQRCSVIWAGFRRISDGTVQGRFRFNGNFGNREAGVRALIQKI